MNHSITKVMYTETGHRLTDYSGKCAHLHGHSYRWEVTATAEKLDYRGMVFDFADLKLAMRQVIEPLDHAMCLHDQDPLVDSIARTPNADIEVLFRSTQGDAPRLFIFDFNPTAENLASYVGTLLQEVLPEYIILEKILVWETANSFCEWRPQ